MARFAATGGRSAASEIHYASEPRRQELFRRLNRAPGGTAALVAMRADLLEAMRGDRGLAVVDRDFQHLFGSWFNRGFLVLRRIDWSSPAAILEKIIRYEAVHEIRDWDELRRRIDLSDRRCYAFFHPALVDEPLIFVEVALTVEPPAAIAPLLAEKRAHVGQDKARSAAFYSISNCQRGLTGVSFGNFLIKQVVEEIRRELPRIETFVTLSPVPGLRAWVEFDRRSGRRTSGEGRAGGRAGRELARETRGGPASARCGGVPCRLLFPESARRRRSSHRSRRPLSPRQRREARSNQLDGGPFAQGLGGILRPHGQLSLRSRRDRAQSRGLRERARGRCVEPGEESFAKRPLALGRASAAGASGLSGVRMFSTKRRPTIERDPTGKRSACGQRPAPRRRRFCIFTFCLTIDREIGQARFEEARRLDEVMDPQGAKQDSRPARANMAGGT